MQDTMLRVNLQVLKIEHWLDDELSMARCLNESEIQTKDDAISYGRIEMAKALQEYIETLKDDR